MAETLDVETAPIGETSASLPGLVSDTQHVEQASDFEPGDNSLELEEKAPDAAVEKGEDRRELIRTRYSRKEMEAMRSRGVREQRRWWEEVYEGLGEVVGRDYDGLRADTTRKQKRRGKNKKAKASPVVCEEFSVNASESLDLLDFSEIACDDANVGSQNGQSVEEWCRDNECINNEDDSSDDEPDSIQRPAFLVEGEPDFDSGPPLDGIEYLRRVRWEAAQIPKVKVAKLKVSKRSSEQTPYMPKIPEFEKCPCNLFPSKLWEDAFLAEYSEIRQAFSELEDSCDQLFSTSHDKNACKDPDHTHKPESFPTMSFLCRMDAVSRASTLRNYISMFESADVLSRDDCLWLFALSVVVDTPLDADMCSSMRCLLRKCLSLLARKSEPDDEVAMLNILVSITGKYFGQSEN
ncbi:unnamed protein product [Musa acuminata subsp. malaccensis]|uniref:(wild Malaysian banana) hypothetical protein n=1 Tax=Musa acuminata subsp. malaccensis TaxID=214687 RepID=A0A804L0G4_MUSAM|nr:PREDICTED: uncharacterized protein LOC103969256 [Musa acuminata subsp. malaccensis]CAG1854619.1 unnamed protein product [Musa acuminata subsp. malaccensis]